MCARLLPRETSIQSLTLRRVVWWEDEGRLWSRDGPAHLPHETHGLNPNVADVFVVTGLSDVLD